MVEAGAGAAEPPAAGGQHLLPPEGAAPHGGLLLKVALGEVVQVHQAAVPNWTKKVSKNYKAKWASWHELIW